jgi:hypothetical protein
VTSATTGSSLIGVIVIVTVAILLVLFVSSDILYVKESDVPSPPE